MRKNDQIKPKRIMKRMSKLDIFTLLATLFTAFMVLYQTKASLLEIIGIFAIIIFAYLYPIFRKKEN